MAGAEAVGTAVEADPEVGEVTADGADNDKEADGVSVEVEAATEAAGVAKTNGAEEDLVAVAVDEVAGAEAVEVRTRINPSAYTGFRLLLEPVD